MKYATLLLAALLGLSQCHKKDQGPAPAPESLLPPATQTGANTFGCLLNGQPWTPSGFNGTSNYSVSYDPTYNGGTFDLRTYRYPSGNQNSDKDQQYIILYARGLTQIGTHDLANDNKVNSTATLNDRKSGCDYHDRYPQFYRRGSLMITRLDLQAGIISGTFDFTLYKPGCDTIKITNGRFDKKL
ncbi:hypothetical protein [Hymenobacter psychrophilus]|uniref:Lipoprotein n=1 Tax=Hymenobacter psychrophilus TaxID=651662 RepID=A0A1H3JCJ6_9BACT|nr:hypothetical protein [Hymenobacter psychrophilus]SDY37750.1 hypothetical protein SAMN04488069_10820 [Hymenobacter psychrophilus]